MVGDMKLESGCRRSDITNRNPAKRACARAGSAATKGKRHGPSKTLRSLTLFRKE